MSRRRPSWGAWPALPQTLALIALALLLAGCGKKGPVRPLLQPLPAAPSDLSLRQVGARFLISWGLPDANQDGTPLTDLRGFRVYKMAYDLGQDCPECRDTSLLARQIDLDYLQDASRDGDRLLVWDGELSAGSGYQIRVVPVTTANREGAPAQQRRPFLASPPAPLQLAGTGLDQQVRLGWAPPAALPAGSDLLGYNLYRRTPQQRFGAHPLNLAPLAATAYDDFAVENGQSYIYGVRTLVRSGGHSAESEVAETAPIVPQPGQ